MSHLATKFLVCHLFCCYHILMSPVICYWTLALFTTKLSSTQFNCCILCPCNLNQASFSQKYQRYIERIYSKEFARVLAKEETENSTEELPVTNSLLFDNAKNQFKWNDSVEHFELLLFHKLRLSADKVTKSGNGTSTVWKTPSVTFKLYSKTKSLLVQVKTVDYTQLASSWVLLFDIHHS